MNGFLWAAAVCAVLAAGLPVVAALVQSRPDHDGGNTGAVVGFVTIIVFGVLAIALAVVGLAIKLL